MAKEWSIVLLVLVLAGCEAISAPNTAATLQAQNDANIAEATALRATADARVTEVVTTAQAAETAVSYANAINRELLATVRAIVPPTQQIIQSAPDLPNPMTTGEVMAESAVGGEQRFVTSGTSLAVRDEDGCVTAPQTSFSASGTERIYATVRAYNFVPGTLVRVEWTLDGQVVWTESSRINGGGVEFCLWFFLQPAYVPFTPGNWSVNLFADGYAPGAPMNFTMTE
jgi:hypothetical protein